MNTESVLTNKDVPGSIRDAFAEKLGPDEQLLFVVVGDLSLKADYGETALGVTETGFMVFDPDREEKVKTYAHADVAEAKVKRMYGNARLRVDFKDGTHEDVFRFTYAVATLADMAGTFIKNVADGKTPEEEYEVVRATYEKLMNVCPKCGRTLLHPGAECINCQSKGKIVKKLVKYVKPETKTLVLCLFLSVLTTAVALVPPYMTGRLVDSVLPDKNRKALLWIVIALFGTYLFQYLIGALRGYLLRVSGDRIVLSLRNDVYKKAQSLPLRFYDKTSTGSVINRISGDTNTIQAFMLRISQEVVVQFFLGVGIIVIMLILNWRLTLLSLIPVPLVVVG
ncbi:MAG: hypothetical protein J6V14_01865, partial [Clostridia bacterium]|nr:hypothetical protein [Clostridia bacterium]